VPYVDGELKLPQLQVSHDVYSMTTSTRVDAIRVVATWAYGDPGQLFRQIGAGTWDGDLR